MVYNEKGMVIFPNKEEWEMTDNDNYQLARKVNGTTWEYIQPKNEVLIETIERNIDFKSNGTVKEQVLDFVGGKTKAEDWYCGTINVNDYDSDEITDYLSTYGEGYIPSDATEEERNQLTCEAIFETDMFTDFNPSYN